MIIRMLLRLYFIKFVVVLVVTSLAGLNEIVQYVSSCLIYQLKCGI